MKMYGGVDVYIHIFLTSSLVGGEWSASCLGHCTPGKSSWYPLDRRLGGPQSRSGRHGKEKILDPTRTLTLTPWLRNKSHYLKFGNVSHYVNKGHPVIYMGETYMTRDSVE
jgi:hypothetical protein